jgi:outer membrane murein-binding lipoprotein Lpp
MLPIQGMQFQLKKQGDTRMRRAVFGFSAVLLGTLVLTSGCTTKKRHQRDIATLQTQIGALQSEVARLDQSVKDSEMALKSAQERGGSQAGVGAGSVLGQFTGGGPIYRTPSGFELPATAIQRALKNAGYYQGPLDGKVGSGTKDALRNFQRDNGLTTDGVCGRQTWARLKGFIEGAAA